MSWLQEVIPRRAKQGLRALLAHRMWMDEYNLWKQERSTKWEFLPNVKGGDIVIL